MKLILWQVFKIKVQFEPFHVVLTTNLLFIHYHVPKSSLQVTKFQWLRWKLQQTLADNTNWYMKMYCQFFLKCEYNTDV